MGSRIKLTNERRYAIMKDLIHIDEETNIKTRLFLTNGTEAYVPTQYALTKGWVKRPQYSINEKQGLYPKLRPKQKEIVPDLKRYLSNNGSLILAASCSFGKTFISLYLISTLDITPSSPCLITMHNIVLIRQWKDRIMENLNKKLIIIEKEEDIDKEADIYIISFIKANKVPISFLKKMKLIIVDEVHMIATITRFQFLLKTKPAFLLGLSATPQRATIPKVLEHFFSKNIIERIEKRDFNVYKVSTGFKPTIESKKGRNGKKQVDWNLVLESISISKPRNEMIVNMVEAVIKRIEENELILMLCKRKNQCTALYEILEQRGISSSVMMGRVNVWDKNKKVLISTYAKIEVGFDESRFRFLFLCTDITQCEQSVGRVFRHELPTVVDFVDDFISLYRHWDERLNWFISRMTDNCEIKEIKIDRKIYGY